MKNVEWGMKNEKKGIPSMMLAGILLLSDQITKYLFSDSNWAYCNPDGPWGMPADNGVLIAVMTVILAGVVACSLKTESFSAHIPIGLILAGGASNLLDRILFGCVRDYAVFSWFPAFNPADVYLAVGVALLLLSWQETCHEKNSK